MITIHHLGISQSERILWLCEELGLDYKIVKHIRAPAIAPDSLKNVPGNNSGKSPFIEDSEAGITLSESGAIADYIIQKYGNGRFALKPDDKNFADYLYWSHFSNGTLQPAMVNVMFLGLAEGVSEDAQIKQLAQQRLNTAIGLVDERLGKAKWLAGDEFTAADIMNVYALTTQRYFGPLISFKDNPNILRWLKGCSARPGYQRAMEKGDLDMKLLLDAEPPSKSMMEVGGVKSDHWKK